MEFKTKTLDGRYIKYAGKFNTFIGLDVITEPYDTKPGDEMAVNIPFEDARSLGDLLLRETLGPPQPMNDEQVREIASDRLVAAAMKVEGDANEEIKTAFLTLGALVKYLPQYNAFARALVGA